MSELRQQLEASVALEVAKAAPAPAPVAMSESAALISMIERAARDPNVNIDKMERLFQMHERVQAMAAKSAYLAALSAMQADLPVAARKGTGHNNKKYARFEDVTEALRPQMKAHSFSLTYRIKQTADRITVVGVLGHAGGHSEETEITLPADSSGSKNNVQAWASSVSYGKRYVALTLTGIATDDDDDGKKAGQLSKETITEEQVIALRDIILSVGADEKRFCRLGGVEALCDIPADQFEAAKKTLAAKAVRK